MSRSALASTCNPLPFLGCSDLLEGTKSDGDHINDDPFNLLVQSVVDYAIYMLDAKGRVTSWNAGAERIKGYSADEIVGQHFSRFYTDEDREAEVAQGRARDRARNGRYEAEGWRVRKDGTRFWASVIIDAIQDNKGQLDRLCQGHPRHEREACGRSYSWRMRANSCSGHKKWRRLGSSPAASHTTSTTC